MFLSSQQREITVSICGAYTKLCAKFLRSKWGNMNELLKREFSFTNDEIFQFLTGWTVKRDELMHEERSDLERPVFLPFKWQVDEHLQEFFEPLVGHLNCDVTTPVKYQEIKLQRRK